MDLPSIRQARVFHSPEVCQVVHVHVLWCTSRANVPADRALHVSNIIKHQNFNHISFSISLSFKKIYFNARKDSDRNIMKHTLLSMHLGIDVPTMYYKICWWTGWTLFLRGITQVIGLITPINTQNNNEFHNFGHISISQLKFCTVTVNRKIH